MVLSFLTIIKLLETDDRRSCLSMIGQSLKTRWSLFLRSSIVQRFMRVLQDLDLHIIATESNNI